jgi:hypothetical protein
VTRSRFLSYVSRRCDPRQSRRCHEDKLQMLLITVAAVTYLGCQSLPFTNCLVTRSVVRADIGSSIGTAVLVSWSSANLAPAAATAVAVVLSPQSSEPLLLGVCVDVGTDDETDDVEEGHPSALWEELLGKGQRDGRDDPADLHDRPEASLDSRADLVECTGTRDERHRNEVYAVLDGGDLGWLGPSRLYLIEEVALTIRLLTRICMIFAFKLLRPWKTFWSRLMRTWPRGALMTAPYRAILGTREVK